MKRLIYKAIKTALLLALPTTFFTVGYLLRNGSESEQATQDFTIPEDTNLLRNDSARLARFQALIDKELDSVQRFPTSDWARHLYQDTLSDTSLLARADTASFAQDTETGKPGNDALQGPDALFTRTYSLAIGKPVPVNVLWTTDSTFLPTTFQLVTITLNDVVEDKAGFTLADPSAVLLHSGANYAADDRISIEDEDHNLHISVLQVQPDSVRIAFAAYLTDRIVSRLKEME